MTKESNISIQGFTRVHMVPRVNQGRTVALAFELPGVPPVAYAAPVQTLQQLFLRIPQVLSDAKKVRAEAGISDEPDATFVDPVPWVVESCQPSLDKDGRLNLAVQLNGCLIELAFSAEQVSALSIALPITKSISPTVKRTSKSVAKKKDVAVSLEKTATSSKSQAKEKIERPKAISKRASAKKTA
jgi:hypothetical protein